MVQKLLTDIGLSSKEALSYETLLRYGTRSTSFVAKKAQLNRGTAYVVLHGLLEKGLVVKSTKHKVQYFTALDPKHLLQYLDHRKQELESQKQRVQERMSDLAALVNPLTTKPKIEFFDGVEGARNVLLDTLTATDKTLRAFMSIYDIAEFVGADFFEQYTQRRVDSGYTLNAIRTLEKDKEAIKSNAYARKYSANKRDRRELRYVPEDLAFPITKYIYDDKLAIISSREENFALIIQSRELAEMQKKMFSLIWNSLPAPTARSRTSAPISNGAVLHAPPSF